MKKIPVYLFCFYAGVSFTSCKDNYTICNVNKTVNYKAGFYNKSGASDVKVTPAAVTLKYPGATNYIYSAQTGLSDLVLSLDPISDSLRYVIKVDNSLPDDTITLVYTSSVKTISPECGDIYVHAFTKAKTTLHTLDSIKVASAYVNNTLVENLRIYY